MPSKNELKDRLEEARKAKNSADKAIKELVDLKVPEQARADKKRLVRRLRRTARRMGKRIPLLRKRIEKKRKTGAKKAVEWVKDQYGTVESPAGSNTGPFPISECQVFTIGYAGVAWCGCLVAYAAIEKGNADIPLKARIAYTPYIVTDAINGTNGLTRVPLDEVEEGDFLVFNFGSGIAKHVGMAVGPIVNSQTDGGEGNTSAGTTGSQDNGGGCFPRQRPTAHVIAAARPDYR